MLSTSRPAELHVPSSPTGEGGGSGRKGLQRKAAGEAALTTPRQIIAPVAVVASEVTRSPISPPPSTGGGGARLSASPLVSDVARRAPQPAHDSPHCLRHPLSQQSRPRGTGSAPPFHKLVQQPANAPAPTTQRPTEATQPEGKALTHEESNHVESSVLSNGDDEMPRLVPLGGAPSSSLIPKQHNLRNGTTTNNIREGLLPVAATPTRGPDVTSEVAVVEGGWSPQPTKPVGNSMTDTSPWSPQQFSVIVASASPSLGHPATPQQTHPRDASYVDSEHRRWSGKQSHPRGVSVGQAPVAELEPNLVTGHPHRHSRIAWIPPTGKHEGGTRVPIENSLGMAAALLAGVTPGVNDGDSCALRGFQPVVGADPPQRRTVSSSPSRSRQHDVIDDGSWAAIGPRYAEPPPTNLAPPSSAIPKPHAEAVRDPLARYLERATAATASQLAHRPPQASAANMLLAQGGNEAGKSSLRPSNNVIKQQQEQDQLGDRASHTVVVVPTSSKSLRGIHHDAPTTTNHRVSPLLSPAPAPSKQSKPSLLSPGIDEGAPTAAVPSGLARQYRPPYLPVTNVKKAPSPPDDLMARRVESIAESTSHPLPPLPAASPPKGQPTTAASSTLHPAALSALNAEEAEERRLVIFEFNQAHHELRLEEQLCSAAVCVAEVVTAKEETVRLQRSLDNQMRARSEDPPLGNTGDKSSTSPHQKATAAVATTAPPHPTRSPSPRNPFPYPLLGGTAAAGRGRRIVPGVADMVASLAGEVEGLQQAYGEQERINRALLKAAEMRSFDLLSQLKRCVVRGLQWPTSVHSDERRERDALLWAFRAEKASSVASPGKQSTTASRPQSEGGGRRLVSPSFDKLVGSATKEPQSTNTTSEKEVAPSVSTVVPAADHIGFRYEEGRRQLVNHEGRAREKIRLKAAHDWERAANTEQDRRLQEGPSPRRRPQEQHAAVSDASFSDVSTIELARPRRGNSSSPSSLAPYRESSAAYRLKMALLELEANEAAERAEICHQEQYAGEEGDNSLRQGQRPSGSDRLSSFWEMLQWWFSSAAANLDATSSKRRLVEAVEESRRDAIAKAAFRGTIDLLQQMLVHKRFIDERVLGEELVALDVSIPDAVVSGAVYRDGPRRSVPSTPPTHTNEIDSSDSSTASITTSTSALNRHRSPSLSDVHDSVHGGSRATRSDVSTSIAAGSSRQVVTPTRSGLGAARRRDADFYELERQGFGEQARLAELSAPISTTTPNQSRRRLSVDISGGSSARRVPGIRVSRNLLTNERLEEAASFRDVAHKGAAHYERLQSLLSTRLNRSPSATPGRVPPSMRTVSGGIRRSSPQRVIPASHPDAFDPGRRTPTRHQREHAAELLQTFLSHGQSAARTPSTSVVHLVVPHQGTLLLPHATRRSSSLSNQTKLRTRPAGLKKAKPSRLPKRVMRRTASSGAGDGGHLADSSATQDVFATPPVPRQHSPHHHRLQERIEQLIREKREVEEELRRERQRAEASLPSTHHLPQTAASLDSDVDEQQHRSIMHPPDQLHSLDPHYSERVHLKQYQAMIRNGGGGTRRLPSTGQELSPSNADSSGHQAAPFSEPSFTEADARYKRRIHQAATKVAGSLGRPANRHPIGEGADWAWAHEGDDDSFFVSRNPTHDIRPVVIPKMRELHPSDEDSSEFEAGSSQQRPTHRRPLSTAADWALAPSTPHRPQSTVEPRHRDGGGVQQGRSVGSAHRPHQRLAFGSAGRHHTDEASQMSSMSGASPRPAPPDQLDGHPFTLNRSLWASQDDGPSIIRQAHSNATAPVRGDARAGSVPSYAAPTAAWRKKRITAGTARKDVFGTNAQRLFNMDASVNESAGISDHPPRRVKVGRGSYLDVFVRQKAEGERAPSTRRPSPPQHISTNNKPTVAISAKVATTVARQQKPRLPVSPQRGPRAASDVSPTHRRTTVAHLNEENARRSPPQPQSHNVTIDLDESDILRRPSSCSTSDADKASPPQQMAPIITAPHTNTKPRGAAVIGKKNSATTATAPATTAAAGARRVKVPSRQAAASSLAGAPKASGERTALSKFEAAALARYHIHNKNRL